MALEITASRLLAPVLGVSLYSWTGIIGVVLLGVAAGNYAGGRIADHSPKLETLGNCLFLGGVFTLVILILFSLLTHTWQEQDPSAVSGFFPKLGSYFAYFTGKAVNAVNDLGLVGRIVTSTTILFLVPMYFLGTVSPQVTRLAVTDWDHAGRVAGRVYAWSCVGAIAGTFATGWGGIPLLGGVNAVVLAVSLVLIVLSAACGRVWRRPAELFIGSIVIGAALFGLGYRGNLTSPYTLETNYYAIRVNHDSLYQGEPVTSLSLDHLVHSYTKPNDPTFMGYPHEEVQAEFARLAADRAGGAANILVIGGGGYTFPRWAEAALPKTSVEVVEIDPGVTRVAHEHLGLARDTRVVTHNMDGRQFVQERAAPGHYQLVIQDAVNDLSVPYHIMTKEYNDAVKRLLTPDGVYLLTVIDEYEDGLLMRAAVRTLRKSFPYVAVLGASALWEHDQRSVFVLYAADRPFDRAALAAAVDRQKAGPATTIAMPADELQAYLDRRLAPVLTDAYAPVDNLISVVFRKRAEHQ
jgi:spermidine synthase